MDATGVPTRRRIGDSADNGQILADFYGELKRCASRHLRRKRGGLSLCTTTLVHETCCRLLDANREAWEGQAHLMAIAAISMRRVLVDYARARLAQPLGIGVQELGFDLDALVSDENDAEIIALDRALDELATFDQRLARVVELRFFGGYSIDQTAAALDASAATVTRDWKLARAWLHRRVKSKLDQ